MSELKDWRGTPIEVGSKVITHSKNWNHGAGIVNSLHKNTITVHLTESDYWQWNGEPKTTLVTLPASVTVLTKDLFDD
jgi:hypothetical protein